jgi:hypothetical protein
MSDKVLVVALRRQSGIPNLVQCMSNVQPHSYSTDFNQPIITPTCKEEFVWGVTQRHWNAVVGIHQLCESARMQRPRAVKPHE